MIVYMTALMLTQTTAVSTAAATDATALSGHWNWKQDSESGGIPAATMNLTLAIEGRRIHGIYCEVTNSGGHIDCAEDGDNVTGRLSADATSANLEIRNKDDYVFHAKLSLRSESIAELSEHHATSSATIKRQMTRGRNIPKDRGACIISVAADRASFYQTPTSGGVTRSYILHNEVAFARGWSADKNFLFVTYDGVGGKRTSTWVLCKEFDACLRGNPHYRGMPEATCVKSLDVVE